MVRCLQEPIGCLVFGRPESTSCFKGLLTYGGEKEVASGRARFDRWEILCLSRVWFSARVQSGGDLFRSDFLPGFYDRHGFWRSALASFVLRQSLLIVNRDYLLFHPPCFLDKPYSIRAVLSYCDRSKHRGLIYRAADFQLARVNQDGIETWFSEQIAPLSLEEQERISKASMLDVRAQKVRARKSQEADDLFSSPRN
jgi:hypothetical protein